jgi:signal peptidase I
LETKLYRWVLWPLWFVVLPLVLAVTIVSLLAASGAPGSGQLPEVGVFGWLRWFARDQKVPAIIVFFTLLEMAIYQLRYALPFADRLGLSSARGVPAARRREYEDASHLLDDVARTLKTNRGAQKALGEDAQAEVDQAMQELSAAMQTSPLDIPRFDLAREAAHRTAERHLARFRRSDVREYTESILIAVGVALLLRSVLFEAFQIPSGSMLPTLQIRDHIFVNKFTYGPKIPFTEKRVLTSLPPARGDIVVFEYPDPNPSNPRVDYIKRAIALPGDLLEVKGGHPSINGWAVPYCHVGPYTFGEETGYAETTELFVEFLGKNSYLTVLEGGREHVQEGPYRVSMGEFWVLGDNRDNSMDSRAWLHGKGAGVPFENVKGRAMFVWLSFNEQKVDPLGVTWDRLFTQVMGTPRLPKEANPELKAGITRCLAERPAVTDPPPPNVHAPLRRSASHSRH